MIGGNRVDMLLYATVRPPAPRANPSRTGDPDAINAR